jgi:hypothetical protein
MTDSRVNFPVTPPVVDIDPVGTPTNQSVPAKSTQAAHPASGNAPAGPRDSEAERARVLTRQGIRVRGIRKTERTEAGNSGVLLACELAAALAAESPDLSLQAFLAALQTLGPEPTALIRAMMRLWQQPESSEAKAKNDQ